MPRLSKIGAAALAAFGWTAGGGVTASYLVVAGGGGGGGSNATSQNGGGAGGAGGFRTGTASLIPTESYTVTVGAGGGGGTGDVTGTIGNNSVFSTITSAGGGGGGTQDSIPTVGGSGGGAAQKSPKTGASGNTPSTSPSQGNNGGNAGSGRENGGGGGGGGVGGNGTGNVSGNGGAGSASSISGSSVTYAGGGGGGASGPDTAATRGTGGSGGGGDGGTQANNGSSGTVNLGGGGGGAGSSATSGLNITGGSGGSGIVIISYVGAQQFGGGVVTSVGGNTIHTFTTSGTLSPLSLLSASYLIVAGGAGGGTSSGAGGGGGAGGLLSGSGVTIDTNSIYLVTVGAGGAASNNGSNSLFSSVSTTAIGGGTGGASDTNGIAGGSGGGASGQTGNLRTGGAGTAGQGNAGGNNTNAPNYGGGGGGGAGAVGGTGTTSASGAGGAGTASSISGSSVTYAGGGGGAQTPSGASAGAGGSGGGGAGGTGVGSAGTANTGGGGGGGNATTGGAGGSGIVIISYPGSTQQMAGGTVTVAGGNVIHTFTSSGYLTPIVLVTNSLRFRASASAYLNRTFGTPTDRNKWTWSGWVKRGELGTSQTILGGYSQGTGQFPLYFTSSNTLAFYDSDGVSTYYQIGTTAVFRDPGAWYHIVVVFDSANAIQANRLIIYVNGVSQTLSSIGGSPGGLLPLNRPSYWNVSSAINNIGCYTAPPPTAYNFFDGYMDEINFIDGQALTPNSFGTLNGLGIWQPIRYGGSYGTNGFYLPFTNTTSTTTLGYDFSPQGNNWTTNNISLTAGTTYDSMLDVPTLTSATQANYCVGNWLNQSDLDILREGNLYWRVDNERAVTGTLSMTTGKWYWEATISAIQNYIEIGIVGTNARFSGPNNFVPGSLSTGYGYRSNATKINNNTTASYGATYAANDVIGVAFDADAGTLTFYKNNSSQGTAYSSIPSNFYVAYDYGGPAGGTTGAYFNFGQRPFTYTPPSGFLALNTFNLAAPTIGATASTTANKYFDATTFDGVTGGGTVTNSGSMQPDFVWMKVRNNANNHELADSVRGTPYASFSNLTNAEVSDTRVSAFNSNGFSYGTNSNSAITGRTVVGWQWRASNATAVTNTAGSITSTVSANTTAGFSVVTYTGNQTAGATVGHGLGVAPAMVIIKCRGAVTSWAVYHSALGATQWILLNSANAATTSSQEFNNTAPTSSVFTIGNSSSNSNQSATYVAYCFVQVAGYSAFGSYTGNGSADGPFVFTNFRPRWIMIKRTDSTQNWPIVDTSRDTYNIANKRLFANLSDAEDTGITNYLDILSNGFKCRDSNVSYNASGGTYIYMAFAENPFKYANARQELICLLDKTKSDQMTATTG